MTRFSDEGPDRNVLPFPRVLPGTGKATPNRESRRKLDKLVDATPVPGLSSQAHLHNQNVSLRQLIYALLLERDDPDEPVRFEKSSLVMLNPDEIKLAREGDKIVVWLDQEFNARPDKQPPKGP